MTYSAHVFELVRLGLYSFFFFFQFVTNSISMPTLVYGDDRGNTSNCQSLKPSQGSFGCNFFMFYMPHFITFITYEI
jgi:hypothetical protein